MAPFFKTKVPPPEHPVPTALSPRVPYALVYSYGPALLNFALVKLENLTDSSIFAESQDWRTFATKYPESSKAKLF